MASITSYMTKQGKRHAVVWRDSSGKACWRTVLGPKRNAEKVKADIETRLALGPLYEAEPERLGPFLEAWLERYGQRVRGSTQVRREQALRALGVLLDEGEDSGSSHGRRPATFPSSSSERTGARPVGGPGVLKPNRVSPRRVQTDLSHEYLQRLTAADVEDAVAALGSHAPRQAQIALASLKLALKDAEKRGQRFDAKILELKPPRSEEREARFLSWPEVEELASWIPEYVRRIVLIAALTGARQGELLALRESDLGLDSARLLIRRSGKGRTKTKRSERSVSLPALAVQLLREQLIARPHTDGGLVFGAPEGGQWNRNNFMYRVFRPATQHAGLDPLPFHALRHTAISLMALANYRAEHIAEQVGHSDGGALIQRRYRHLFPGEMDAAAKRLDALVREKPDAKEETG